jgi:hypothetical protein
LSLNPDLYPDPDSSMYVCHLKKIFLAMMKYAKTCFPAWKNNVKDVCTFVLLCNLIAHFSIRTRVRTNIHIHITICTIIRNGIRVLIRRRVKMNITCGVTSDGCQLRTVAVTLI